MKHIGIASPLSSTAAKNMLNALGEVLDVRFEERAFGNDAGVDAWLLPDADERMLERVLHCSRPCYAVVRGCSAVNPDADPSVVFASHSVVPPVLRGRSLGAGEDVTWRVLPSSMGDAVVLASRGGQPVWAVRQFGGLNHHFSALPVPELDAGAPLFPHFCGRSFARLAPLLLFLRVLAEDPRWVQPPLQACLMFDDPNLHWRTYGFIDFAKLASHAREHNYHVAFATIPLDAWYVNRAVALLFRGHSERLSLLIHGNDHRTRELARPDREETTEANLRQALARIGELERRSGLQVARAMVPPHGACSERTLSVMARIGIEAACISPGSLRAYNADAPWIRTVGVGSVDMIGGLPVFPRVSVSGTCVADMVVAALLGQPIIIRGHHSDIAHALGVLARIAEQVNSLGEVRWSDVRQIARSYYLQRLDGRLLRVRMLSRRIELAIPEGIHGIIIEQPRSGDAVPSRAVWRCSNETADWRPIGADGMVPARSGGQIEIAVEEPPVVAIPEGREQSVRVWPVIRRQLTEARDRLAPAIRKIAVIGRRGRGVAR